MQEETKFMMLTREETELLLDSFKVTNPLTRGLALKAAGLVLEWAANEGLTEAESILGSPGTGNTSSN
jgi:hypothetical protein